MSFASLSFICIFLPCVLLLNFIIPTIKLKNYFLILASLIFYAYGEPIYVLLMIFSVILNWLIAKGVMNLGSKERQKKFYLGCGICINLILLCTFKYANFLCDTFSNILHLAIPSPNISLPIGISFFTFQAMSYLVDAYRGEVQKNTSLSDVMLYISFFPQLIAGPIIKYHDIATQINDRYCSIKGIAYGMRRFSFGLGKKVLLANTLGIVVDSIYSLEVSELNFALMWLAAIAYMLQIYFDFSGYSDMAIGMARMFGFDFKENFDHPFVSKSIKEFWRRWHISLSTWFKEYLYIPLGGNRLGKRRTVINKLIVFLLCGLWHGANWTFVIWGALHGFFLLLEEYLPINKLPKYVAKLYALLVICLTFVIFRSDTIFQALDNIRIMFFNLEFTYSQYQIFLEHVNPYFIICFTASVLLASKLPITIIEKYNNLDTTKRYWCEFVSYIIAIIVLFLSICSLSTNSYNPFIYFRF